MQILPSQYFSYPRYRSVLGCFVIEGYGQTENCGVATMSLYGDTIPGHVGVPAPGVHVKLNDVPDMNYNASEGKGEVSFFLLFIGFSRVTHLNT